jgi:hypothetical protein
MPSSKDPNANNLNNLDIWGESLEESKECFLCGSNYLPKNSTAPDEYKNTFCSLSCYDYNNEQMKKAIEAEEKLATLNFPESKPKLETNEVKIGDFVFRVVKEGE